MDETTKSITHKELTKPGNQFKYLSTGDEENSFRNYLLSPFEASH